MSPLLLRTSMQFYLHFPMVLSTYHSQISHQKVHQNRPILIYYIEKSQNFPALRPGPPQTPQLLRLFASRTNIITSLRSAISGVFWNIHSHACKFAYFLFLTSQKSQEAACVGIKLGNFTENLELISIFRNMKEKFVYY